MKKTLIFAAIVARGGVVHQPRLPHLLHAQEDPDQPHGEGQGHQEVWAAIVVMIEGMKELRPVTLTFEFIRLWKMDRKEISRADATYCITKKIRE